MLSISRKYLVLPLLCFAAHTFAGNTLHVAAQQRHVITQATLALDELILDDGAELVVAPDLERVSIRAAKARIGKQVLIDARGHNGARGADGHSYVDSAANCAAGAAGGAGVVGGNGGNGRDITLELGVAAIGDVRIAADGGNGGDGGSGGNGQRGGEVERCYGKDGGAGGAGGEGGRGGDGGSVTLRYWRSNAALAPDVLTQAFAVSVRGGLGGSGGKAGSGGGVGAGKYLSTAYGGGKKWLSAGEPGADGAPGRAGVAGNAGAVSLSQQDATVGAVPVAVPVQQTKSASRDYEALLLRIEQLEKRVQTLEAQPR